MTNRAEDTAGQETALATNLRNAPSRTLPYFGDSTGDEDWARLARRVSWLALIIGLSSAVYHLRSVLFLFRPDLSAFRVLGPQVFGVPLYTVAEVINSALALILIVAAIASLFLRPSSRIALLSFGVASICVNVPITIANQIYYYLNRFLPSYTAAGPPPCFEVSGMVTNAFFSTMVLALFPLVLLLILSLPAVKRLYR